MNKDVVRQLILMRQEEFPVSLIDREKELPFLSERIVTVAGARRCGKSTLMAQAANRMLREGMDKRKILWVDFDDERFIGMTSEDFDLIPQAYRELFPDIPIGEVIMFFDEIQTVDNWEYFVMRLYKHYCRNIYISGSNASMLSTELKSVLRGWPDEYLAYPLSFREYCTFRNISLDNPTEAVQAQINAAFDDFNANGGFPQVVLTLSQMGKVKLLQGYFETMLLRDLGQHFSVGNLRALRYLLKRVMENLTKPTSLNGIFNDMRSQGVKVSKNDVYDWVRYACDVFLLMPLPRWSASLGEQERALKKFYCIDNGLRSSVLLPQSEDFGKGLENVVYLELRRRLEYGEQLFYYSSTRSECDFLMQRGSSITTAVQVCWDVSNPETLKREIKGLEEAHLTTGASSLLLLTRDQTQTFPATSLRPSIEMVSIWKWLIRQ